VTGRLADLLDRAQGELAGLADAWVKVVLTDPGRLANPMEQLRAHWPHTLVLEFAPERDVAPLGLTRMTEASDPVEICAEFVSAVSGGPPSTVQRAVLAEVVLAAQRVEASA
jgi:exonuclease SbcD